MKYWIRTQSGKRYELVGYVEGNVDIWKTTMEQMRKDGEVYASSYKGYS